MRSRLRLEVNQGQWSVFILMDRKRLFPYRPTGLFQFVFKVRASLCVADRPCDSWPKPKEFLRGQKSIVGVKTVPKVFRPCRPDGWRCYWG